jgi:hypothetical protein
MQFRAQLDRSLAVLSQHGLSRNHAEPLLFRLLWKLGVRVRPPHFLGFASIALVFGTWFAGAWGVFMWTLVWSHQASASAAWRFGPWPRARVSAC